MTIKIYFNSVKEKLYYPLKNKVISLTKGEIEIAKFDNFLWIWGGIPIIFVVLWLQPKLNLFYNTFFAFILEFFLLLYFSWNFYVIKKIVKLHPELKPPKKPSRKKLYANKTEAEIKEIKKQKKQEFIDKMMLKKSWRDTPGYYIVLCSDLFLILQEIQLLSQLFR
jgi:large-conductance mechanosensitive channel